VAVAKRSNAASRAQQHRDYRRRLRPHQRRHRAQRGGRAELGTGCKRPVKLSVKSTQGAQYLGGWTRVEFRVWLSKSLVGLSKSPAFQPVLPPEEIMPTVEAQLRQELRNHAVELRDYAIEVRQLAYTVPNGVGEHDLLGLSGRMRADADEVVREA
jgi:hypothetical protein